MAKEDSVKWSEVKNSLKTLDKNELIDLIRDLYRYSAENRRIIIRRHPEEKKSDWVLESFQRVIRNEFFPDKGLGGLHSDVTRKAIMDYSEGSGDLEGTMELMLLFVENVVEFVNEYGDIDEEFYDEGYEMLRKFCELLKTAEGQGFYPLFKERLFKLRRESDDFGYGFGDDIAYYVKDVEDFFEEDLQ
ncbi:TPA: hypothetical protein HA351_13475 [Methanosarcinaceae archaeon]|nr:hypothetical protein [Methanosarcinaceae archaeon]